MNAAHLTADDLKTMRVRDAAVTVYVDHFGGRYVLSKDGRMHGQHAIMDRRRLLEHLVVLDSLTKVANDIVQIQPVLTTHGFGQFRECGWVIEAPPMAGQSGPAKYLLIQAGDQSVQFTEDSRQALRFARDEDCIAFMNLSPVLSAILTRPAFKEWVSPC